MLPIERGTPPWAAPAQKLLIERLNDGWILTGPDDRDWDPTDEECACYSFYILKGGNLRNCFGFHQVRTSTVLPLISAGVLICSELTQWDAVYRLSSGSQVFLQV
jgi:hypothetical protein